MLKIIFCISVITGYFLLIVPADDSRDLEEALPEDGILVDGDIIVGWDEDPWDRRGQGTRENRWPGATVYYTLDSNYSLWDEYVIESAMKAFEDFSCIRFVKRTQQFDYVAVAPLGGCWSWLGRKGGEQPLSLSSPACIQKGTVMHELMHALGFWHEHSRPDRDDYITIHWNNVVDKGTWNVKMLHRDHSLDILTQEFHLYNLDILGLQETRWTEKQANFVKHTPLEHDDLSLPYDFESLMHYNAWAFAKSREAPTITPKPPRVRLSDLGKAKKMNSFTMTDRAKLIKAYGCRLHL